MKKLLDRRGSALIWAIVVICVLFIAVAGILTLCMSYYNRTLAAVEETNAFLSARSAIDYIASDITDGGGDYKPDANGEIDAQFDFEPFPCTVHIVRESDERLHIRATAEYNGGSSTLNALLACTISYDAEGNPIESWEFTGYLDK